MSVQLPAELAELRCFLEKNAGMTITLEESIGGFGSAYVVMEGEDLQVRFVNDRGQWGLEVGVRTASDDQLYDMLILQEFMTGEICDEPFSLVEEVRILTESWDAVRRMFSYACVKETESRLSKLRDDRAKRLFPEWYQ